MKPTRIYKRKPIADRVNAKLAQQSNGCLEFTGSRMPRGYGVIHAGGANGAALYVHRVVWELAHGPIPDGLWVLHHCDNPPCVQTEPTEGYPDGHLFLGTRLDNVRDMWNKGRASAPPHRYGEKHHHATVSDATVRECREEYAAGLTAKRIAETHGVLKTAVYQWAAGKSRIAAGGPITLRAQQ